MKFNAQPRWMEGVITKIESGGYTIELKGRIGTLSLPKRFLIADKPPKIGDEVGFMLSYPEVLNKKRNV